MDKNGSLTFQNTAAVNTTNNFSVTRAKSFKVKTTPQDFAQYVRTVKAYALAGLSFEDIANAGDLLCDEVERKEIDAALAESQSKVGEVAEDESQILAWQNRGEKVSIDHQLSYTGTLSGNEVVIVSQDLAITEITQEKTINVLEGINVLNEDAKDLIEDNPYLKKIGN